MNEYIDMNYTEATLKFLRKHTLLSPISLIKIERLKEIAEKFHNWYLLNEREELGIDYSAADKLEFKLRFNEWQKGCVDAWEKYGKNMSLGEFSRRTLESTIMEEEKKKKKTKKWI